MKKILLFLLTFLLLGTSTFAQSDTKPTDANFKNLSPFSFSYYVTDNSIWIYKTSLYGWTKLSTARSLQSKIDSLANIGYTKVKVDSLLSLKLNSADSLNKYITPTYLSVNYLKKSDTASMLNPYASKILIGTKLNKSDTAIMLNHYAKITLVNAKLSITDTSSMLTNYRIGLNNKLNKTDTTAMLAKYLLSIGNRVKYADTSSMLANYKIGINSRVKVSDTVSMLNHYATKGLVNTKVNISDTLSMLANYKNGLTIRPKWSDTTFLNKRDADINRRLKISDTSSMMKVRDLDLRSRLKFSDTTFLNKRDIIINSKMAHSDSTSTDGYVRRDRLISALLPKLNISDTSVMMKRRDLDINSRLHHNDSTDSNGYTSRQRLTSELALKENLSNKGVANGYASLDSGGKVPLSQINDVLLGAVSFQDNYNPVTNSPSLPTASGHKGWYYIISANGIVSGLADSVHIKDWIVSNGVAWGKVSSNSIYKVFGRTGQIIAQSGDYTTDQVTEGTNKYDKIVAISNGTGISVTGTYPNFTITNSSPSSGGTVTGTGTTDELTYWTGTNSIGTLSTGTYPSKTELSYVKGVTGAIQTQLNGKQATLVSGTNIRTVGGNTLLGSSNIPFPTLSDLSGQPQLNGTGFVKAVGTTISYDNSTYEPSFGKNTGFNKNFGSTSGTVLEGRTFGTAANNNTGDFRSSSWVPAFTDLSSHPTTLSGYGITDTPWTVYQPLENQRLSTTNSPTFNNGAFSGTGYFGSSLTIGTPGSSDGNITMTSASRGIAKAASLSWNMNTSGGYSNTAIARIQPDVYNPSRSYVNFLDFYVGSWNNNNNTGAAKMSLSENGDLTVTSYISATGLTIPLTGLLKGNGSNAVSVAVAGSDYSPAHSAQTNYLLKSTGSGGIGQSSIYDNGNIGIGTTDPAGYKLNVNGAGHFSESITIQNSSSYGSFISKSSDGSHYTVLDYNSINATGGDLYFSTTGGNFRFIGSIIATNSAGDISTLFVSPSTHNTYIEFPTGHDLIIRNNAGTVVADFSGGSVNITGNGAFTGSVTAAGGGFNSLRSLKNIHKDWVGSALNELMKFKLRDFNYKVRPDYDETLGFIIDEIPNSIAKYVLSGKNKDAINTYTMIGITIKALQEANTKIESLEKRINDLEKAMNQVIKQHNTDKICAN